MAIGSLLAFFNYVLLAFAVPVDELNGCPDQLPITSDQYPLDGVLRLAVSNATQLDLRCSNRSLLYWKSAYSDRILPLCTLNFSHLSSEHFANVSGPPTVDWSIHRNSSQCQSASLQLSSYAEFEPPIENGSLLFDTDCACYHNSQLSEQSTDLNYTSPLVNPSTLANHPFTTASSDNGTSVITVEDSSSMCQFGNETTSCNSRLELDGSVLDSEPVVTAVVRRPAEDPCANDPCQPNGICVSRNDSFDCHCSPNFCGEFCQFPLVCSHECEVGNKSCMAAQVCVCLNAQATSSPSTEMVFEMDVCHEHACLHNATCVPTENGTFYECVCASGFTGKLCEMAVTSSNVDNVTSSAMVSTVLYTVSVSSPLMEDVTTTDQPQEPKCDWPCLSGSRCIGPNRCGCSSYYLGANCGFLHTCKMYMPCQNGGDCVLLGLEKLKRKVSRFQTNAPFHCLCKDGWMGKHCETSVHSVDMLLNKRCMNSGRYDPRLGRCDCEGTGHVGDLCEIEINRCAENRSLCGANGICTKTGPNTFKCNCLTGYQGETCDVTVNSAGSSAVIIGAVFGSLSAIGLVLGSIVMARYVRRSRELKVPLNNLKTGERLI
uniref:EGF-like domain-containing protein n=1 Tax=Trichuris muris TaxID=70415 RepID=A0A5S6R0R9_TRIMR